MKHDNIFPKFTLPSLLDLRVYHFHFDMFENSSHVHLMDYHEICLY